MKEKPTRWKSVKSETMKWEEEGEKIEGVYMECRQRAFGDRTTNLFTVAVEGRPPVSFWGTTVLDRQMEHVPKGSWVRIIYKGKKGEGERRYRDFDVSVADDTESSAAEGVETDLS